MCCSGGVKTFCCDNHVRINGVCVECEPGTKSKNEEPCTLCSPGKYGRKCRYPCNCKILERCDIVIGCVNNNTSSVQSEVRITTCTTSNNQDTTRDTNGPSKTELLLYSAGFGGLILFIVSFVILSVCLIKNRSKQSQNIPITLQNDHWINADNDTTNDDSLYESIDESAICEDNFQNRNPQEGIEEDENMKSESKLSSIKSENSGYLHPYTTFTESKNTHVYCTKAFYSDNTSTSSSSGNEKRYSGYTHPYQQLNQKELELRPAQTSDYTELTVVHYLELVDVQNNIGSASGADFPDYNDSKRSICAGVDNENVHPMRHSSLAKFGSVQHLNSPFEMNCQDLTHDHINKAVKHNSI